MKKLLVLLLALFSGATIQAQLLIGPKAGLQVSTSTFNKIKEYSDSVTTSPAPGFSLGTVLNLRVNNPLSLQFELNYSYRGRVVNTVYEPLLKHTEYNHFIEVPALFRYSKGKKTRTFYINAGPNLSYWLGGRGKISSSFEDSDTEAYTYKTKFGENKEEEGKVYIKDANRFQIGVDFGGGMILPVQNGRKLMVELRYSVGHSYMGKADSVRNNIEGYSDNRETSHHALNLSVAYVFDYKIHGWKKGKSVSK